MTELEIFNCHFKSLLVRKGIVNFNLNYERPFNPNAFTVWLQYYLDKLGVEAIKYKMIDGNLYAEDIILQKDYLTQSNFPYEIIFKEASSSKLYPHEEIKEVKLII